MPPTWRSVVAVVALLALAGCAGLADTGDSGPSPDEFPDASDVDPSMVDTHAAEMGNTSFTLTSERVRKDRAPETIEQNFTYKNATYEYFVEPSDSQYLAQYRDWFAGGANISMYSNGSTTYETWRQDDERTIRHAPLVSVFNESSRWYLWGSWFGGAGGDTLAPIAINASYEREGIETFQGVSVMRYEASGVDALPADLWDGNASRAFEEFSATVLLDQDGVVRHYQFDFVYNSDYRIQQRARTFTLSDVNSAEVERPDWVPDGVAE